MTFEPLAVTLQAESPDLSRKSEGESARRVLAVEGEVVYGQVIQLKLYLNSFLALKTHMSFSQETICVSITLGDLTLNHLNSQGQWFKSQVFILFYFFQNWASTEHSDANLAVNPWSCDKADRQQNYLNGREVNQ